MESARLKQSIKILMKTKNINLNELSRITDIKYCVIAYLILNPFSRIPLTLGIRICKALDVSIKELV